MPGRDNLKTPHVFAGNPLDRGEAERRDPDTVRSLMADPKTRFLPLWRLNVPLVSHSQATLAWQGRELLDRLPKEAPEPVLLGFRDGVAHFAADASGWDETAATNGLSNGAKFEDARSAATQVSQEEAGIIAQGRAQIDWHRRHRFCSVCGTESVPGRNGQMRQCPSCGAQHFPRTDPVVIMLVHHGDKCLMGQTRARHRSGFYSCLAGFMDQGESIEEGVRREVLEEAGLEVGDVRYHSSQPWPFPSSLMIGCHATALSDEIHFDPEEMADVRWLSRDEAAAALRGEHPEVHVPGPIAIAHHLIKAWVTGEVF